VDAELTLELALVEPRLAPLAEALTRPQLPARPASAAQYAALDEAAWENAFVIVCGRLLALGPWRERAARILAALDRLGPEAAEIAPIVTRLVAASADPARPLVFADELLADPGLLDLHQDRFGPGAELVVYAPGWTAEQAVERLGPLVDGAPAEIQALAVPPGPESDEGAAQLATAVLSARSQQGPFAALPRIAPPEPAHFLSICTIFKNEAGYLREWIEFHRLVGVDHFYLYENRSEDDFAPVLAPYVEQGIVTLHAWPLEPGQNPAYTHCLTEHGAESEWIAFMDADEFFYAPGGDLRAALAEFDLPHVGGVAVNYVNYGTSGHRTPPDGLVTESYVRRAGHETALDLPAGLKAPGLDPTDLRNYHPLNARVSTVVRRGRALRFEIPHYPVYRPGFHAVTENHERVDGPMAPRTSVAKLRMNHYWTKSEAECRAKFERGRSAQSGRRVWPDDFLHRDRALNEVEDTEIHAWLEPLRLALAA